MRTFKFRGKCTDPKYDGKTACGSLLSFPNGETKIFEHDHDKTFNYFGVDPDTVCQFTGFTDKNGKEIYEGDVLRSDKEPSGIFPLSKDPHMAVVCWSEEHGVFYRMTFKAPKAEVFLNANRSCHVLSRFIRSYEVIGNIHEPEWEQKFGGRTNRKLSIEIFDND